MVDAISDAVGPASGSPDEHPRAGDCGTLRRGSLGTGLEPDPGLVEQVTADLDAILSHGMRDAVQPLC